MHRFSSETRRLRAIFHAEDVQSTATDKNQRKQLSAGGAVFNTVIYVLLSNVLLIQHYVSQLLTANTGQYFSELFTM